MINRAINRFLLNMNMNPSLFVLFWREHCPINTLRAIKDRFGRWTMICITCLLRIIFTHNKLQRTYKQNVIDFDLGYFGIIYRFKLNY